MAMEMTLPPQPPGGSTMSSRGDSKHSALARSRPETPLTEDPSLGITILPSTGEGEHSMKIFIQEHMTSILHPMAETVQELSRTLKKLSDDTVNLSNISERNSEHIGAHEQRLLLFGAGLSRTNDDLTCTRNDLSEVMDKQVTLEGDLDLTKVTLNKTEGILNATANAGQESRKLADDIDSRLRQTQLSLSEANVTHLGFADRLSELRNLHDGLNDRHMQMMTSLQQVKQSDENTRSMMKRHIGSVEKQKKDDQRSFSLLDERVKTMEAMILDISHKTSNHAKQIKVMSSDLRHCVAELGEVIGVQQGQAAKDQSQDTAADKDRAERQTGAEKFSNRMTRLEEGLAQLHRQQNQEKEAVTNRHKDMQEVVYKVAADVKENSGNLDALAKTAKYNEDRLIRNETKIAQAESNIDKVFRLEEKVDGDVRQLGMNLRDLQSTVEYQKHELGKTNTNLANTRQDIESTNGQIKQLNLDLVDMQGAMTKIGTRLELAHEYFQGMSKGFQDTHKRVTAGADGMIPPKTISSRKMLPDIPGSKLKQGAADRETPQPG